MVSILRSYDELLVIVEGDTRGRDCLLRHERARAIVSDTIEMSKLCRQD